MMNNQLHIDHGVGITRFLLQNWKDVLQFGADIVSKCVLLDFAHLIGLDVHAVL
jgi:hypothetical protein